MINYENERAGEVQETNRAALRGSCDYIIVGAGASGSIIAGELSKTGADVLVVESGGEDAGPTVTNPSIWFYNVGGPFDWALPIAPVPQLNNRHFKMALGHVLGGGSSVNAMVWTRGTERDYDAWERNGATGWAFKDVLPTSRPRRIGKAAQTSGAVRVGPFMFAGHPIRIQQHLPSSRPPGKWAFLSSMI